MNSLTNVSALPVDWSNFNSSLIIEVTRPDGVYTSTGVAINQTTVLTAAHCLEGEILKVRISTQSSYNPKGKFWKAESYELHPDYDSSRCNYSADLAKIKLSKPLPSDLKYYPIIKKDQIQGRLLRLGFGARSDKNIRTMVTPQFMTICHKQKVLRLSDHFSFSGDSGGPVFLQSHGQMYLVAIHSTLSIGPQGKESFNPLLSSHRDWIAA